VEQTRNAAGARASHLGPVALLVCLALWTAEGVWFLCAPPAPLVSDAHSYWLAGQHLLLTGTVGDYWPPLYPLLVAAAQRLGGLSVLVAAQTTTVWGIVAGTAWVVRRRHGSLAGGCFLLLLAIYPVLYVFSRFAMTDSFFACGILLWVVLTGSRHPASQIGAAVLLAALVLLRPEAVAVCIAATAWNVYRRRFRPAAAQAALPGLALLLWGAYNLAHDRGFVVTQSNFWVNLWVGNNDLARGTMVYLGPADASASMYRSLFLSWLRTHPLRFADLCIDRVALFWLTPVDFLERTAVAAHVVPRAWPVLAVATVPIFPLILVWSVNRFRGHPPATTTAQALVAIAAQWAFVVPFFVQARFRTPALPLVALVAAEALARWEADRRSSDECPSTVATPRPRPLTARCHPTTVRKVPLMMRRVGKYR